MAGDFDFWVGEWDGQWEGGRGSNTVTSELDGSVILERFDGRPGTTLQGLSLSVFDRERECWRQTWVDSNGGYLDFTGGVGDDGVMELRHEQREATARSCRSGCASRRSNANRSSGSGSAARRRERGASSGGSSTRVCPDRRALAGRSDHACWNLPITKLSMRCKSR